MAAGTHGDIVANGGEVLLGLAGDGEAADLGVNLPHPPAPCGATRVCVAATPPRHGLRQWGSRQRRRLRPGHVPSTVPSKLRRKKWAPKVLAEKKWLY